MSDTPAVKLGFAKVEHGIIDDLRKTARDATMDLLSVKKDLFQTQSELSATQQKLEAAERNAKEFERDWLDACDKNAELTRKLKELIAEK